MRLFAVPFVALLAFSLTGCGAGRLTGAPAASMLRLAGTQATRDANPAVATAETAIRASLEKRIADYNVSLANLTVQLPAAGSTVYGFAADEQISGLGGATHYHLQGSYDATGGAVKVLHRDAIAAPKP